MGHDDKLIHQTLSNHRINQLFILKSDAFKCFMWVLKKRNNNITSPLYVVGRYDRNNRFRYNDWNVNYLI